MNKKLLIAGFAAAIAIPLTACGGGAAAGGNQADVQACTNLQKTASAFLANKNQDTLDAFASALATRPGAMSPSLDAAFSALSDDIQNEMLTDSTPATAQTDESAVADGCASAGVPMPSGFTG